MPSSSRFDQPACSRRPAKRRTRITLRAYLTRSGEAAIDTAEPPYHVQDPLTSLPRRARHRAVAARPCRLHSAPRAQGRSVPGCPGGVAARARDLARDRAKDALRAAAPNEAARSLPGDGPLPVRRQLASRGDRRAADNPARLGRRRRPARPTRAGPDHDRGRAVWLARGWTAAGRARAAHRARARLEG